MEGIQEPQTLPSVESTIADFALNPTQVKGFQRGFAQDPHTNEEVRFYKCDDPLTMRYNNTTEPLDMVEIRNRIIKPNSVCQHVVSEEDKYRWPAQWAAYKAGEKQLPGGTMLDDPDLADILPPGIANEFMARGVMTLEALAVQDAATLGAHGADIAAAQAEVQKREREAPAQKVKAEMEERLSAMEEKQNQILELLRRQNEPPRIGRPPKQKRDLGDE